MPHDWAEVTVAAEEADPQSVLWQYRTMLRLRRELASLAGDDLMLPESDPGLLVITRGPGFACVVNCSAATLASPVEGRALVASDPSVMVEGGRVTLPPSTGAWILSD